MPLPARTLAVVGADYPNKRGPGRRFELEVCKPGETVHLVPEPRNPADPRAVAVFSARHVQIGYLTAERCGLVARTIAEGREIRAVFQGKASFGAFIRIAFDGEEPILPQAGAQEDHDEETDFYPDFIPPDE